MARILGVDPGRKRIGIALSDELLWTAEPLEVWACRSKKLDARHVVELARTNDANEIVIGVPRRLDGTENDSTLWARAFVAAVREAAPDIAVIERDETLTSWAAEERLRAAGRYRAEKGAFLDAYAAAVILQDELDERASRASSQRYLDELDDDAEDIDADDLDADQGDDTP